MFDYASNLPACVVRQNDTALVSDAFESGGKIDTLAINVALVQDYVSNVQAYSEADPAFGGALGLGGVQRLLERRGGLNGRNDRAKKCKQAITGKLDNLTSGTFDAWIDDVPS